MHPQQFWQLLLDGVDAVRDIPPHRWNHARFHDPRVGIRGKTSSPQAGLLDRIDEFDAAFFGISPREAASIDPQHRLLLEVAWEALEDAGCPLSSLAGSATGVFVGTSSQEYRVLQNLLSVESHAPTGLFMSMAANRISHFLNLAGPSLACDTACSSALMALHAGCQSMWRGESSMALVGSVNLLMDPGIFVIYSGLSTLSPDGRCRAFDAHGKGFVRAEGAGVVVLKPLARAQADGDRIYAVILATATNQDGRGLGLTVPNQTAQEALLGEVYAQAGVPLHRVAYVEAHGTGTPVGDPIEARSIGTVLGAARDASQPLLLGSVKTNIGHLGSASGMPGLMKAALVLRHRTVPRNVHFDEPHPDIAFDDLRLRVPTENVPLPPTDGPAVVGVNSFGLGGSNVHAVLAEAPAPEVARPSLSGTWLLPLSARDPGALRALASRWREFLREGAAPLYDIRYTAARRRTHHAYRLAAVGDTPEALEQALAVAEPVSAGHGSRVAFIFCGNGAQWWGMGRDLWATEPVYRAAIERCDEVVRRLAGWSLVDELMATEEHSRVTVTEFAQPAIVAVQIALVELWRSWGITPHVVLGHSLGEIAAAWTAGMLSLDTAIEMATHRGRCLRQARAGGRMLAVACGPNEVRRYLEGCDDVYLAAENSPCSVTLSGDGEALERLGQRLRGDGIDARMLINDVAFHSPHVQHAAEALRQVLGDMQAGAAQVVMLSSVHGRHVAARDLDTSYWVANMRQPVRFAEALRQAIDDGCEVFLEIGAHPVLSGYVAESLEAAGGRAGTMLASLRRKQNDRMSMLSSLGALYAMGETVRWDAVYATPTVMASLPHYAWQRQRYWQEGESSRRYRCAPVAHPLLGDRLPLAEPAWNQEITAEWPAFLADHALGHQTLVSASAYCDMALAAAREVWPRAHALRLEEVVIHQPCILDAGDRVTLQTTLSEDEGTFRIYSRQQPEAAWVLHANGRVFASHGPEPVVTADLEALRRRCTAAGQPQAYYEHSARMGLHYGPSFQTMAEVWVGEGEAFGRIQGETAAEFVLPPAMLDGAFQIPRLIPDAASGDSAWFGIGVDRFRFYGAQAERLPSSLFAHVVLRSRDGRDSVTDFSIYDGDGRLLACLDGYRARATSFTNTAPAASIDGLLHQSRWRLEPLSLPPERSQVEPGRWLIFADDEGPMETLIASLRAHGARLTTVHRGDAWAISTAERDGSITMRAGDREHMRRLLDTVGPLDGVVHGWSLGEDPSLAQERGTLCLLHLLQTYEALHTAVEPTLWVLTQRAQAVHEKQPVDPTGAPLWGMVRAWANEHPRLIDLGDPAADMPAVLDELLYGPAVDEVALRAAGRYVHDYVRWEPNDEAPRRTRLADPQRDVFRLDLERPGSLDYLRLIECDAPQPGATEVVIRVAAAGLNFSDVMKVLGLYPDDSSSSPILGGECAGIVESVGSAVTHLRPGDRGMAMADRTFGTLATTEGALAVPMPAGWTFEQAATVPLAFLTASYALLHLARLSRGERVLIHAASGGVGMAAIQVARAVGAEVLATAGSEAKRDLLRSMGIRHVFDSRGLQFGDDVMNVTGGQGVDVVLNSLPGAAIDVGLGVLRPFGRFLELGKTDLWGDRALVLRPLRRNLSYHAIDLQACRRQRPALLGTLLETIREGCENRSYQPLPHVCHALNKATEAFHSMASAKHTGKLVITPSSCEIEVATTRGVRPDGTYLISGGASPFNLALARHLIERGARSVALVSRSAAASRARQATSDLGSRVTLLAADISDATEVSRVLRHIDENLPPLIGIIHGANHMLDRMLGNVNDEEWMAVLRPKMMGAWHLHRLTRDKPLDFFIMSSSISAIVGKRGQAAYAAANAFLDALAWHRHGLGLAAMSINWGALGEHSWLGEHPEVAAQLEASGSTLLTWPQVSQTFDRLLELQPVSAGVLRMDWSRWRAAHGHMPSRLRSLQHVAAGNASRDSWLARLQAAAPDQRAAVLVEAIKGRVARVLRVPVEQLDERQPLNEIGLDSLMSTELRNWVRETLHVALAAGELMRGPSIERLCELLLSRLAAEAEPAAAVMPRHASELLVELPSMSDDAVDALLSQMLTP